MVGNPTGDGNRDVTRPSRSGIIGPMRTRALATLAALAIAGCHAREPAPSPAAAPACVFRYALPEPPGSLDPTFVRSSLDNLVAPNLFEGLMNFPEADGPPRPGVAERFEVSPDGRTYTFHLRQARWTDGEPVTAADFVYAWRRALEPATGAPYADILYFIEGARAFHDGQSKDFGTVGLRAADDRTLVVRLEQPAPFFPELTAFFTYLPVPRRAVEAHGTEWTRPGNLVGNGPFRLVADEPGRRLVLEKNPDYWDAAHVGADRLEVLIINDGATAVNLIETGQLDWSGLVDLPPVRLAELARRPEYRTDPWLATHFLRLNAKRPPFDDARVRRAVALAIDRDALAAVVRGGNRPARGITAPLPGWPGVQGPAFDPDAARRLLAAAGFGPDHPLRFRLHYPNDELRRLLVQAVAGQLQKNLGAQVEPWVEEFRVYLRTQDQGDYDVSLSRWAGDYSDATTFLDLWTSGSIQNKTGWADGKYDGLVARAHGLADPAARTATLVEAEARVLDEAPIVPLLFGAKDYLIRPGFGGIGANSLGNHMMRYVTCAGGSR
jgi:oligopeptide transport system substrate-binding protein